jgi:hypothetical protein
MSALTSYLDLYELILVSDWDLQVNNHKSTSTHEVYPQSRVDSKSCSYVSVPVGTCGYPQVI